MPALRSSMRKRRDVVGRWLGRFGIVLALIALFGCATYSGAPYGYSYYGYYGYGPAYAYEYGPCCFYGGSGLVFFERFHHHHHFHHWAGRLGWSRSWAWHGAPGGWRGGGMGSHRR
jgi:hypothetical protein